MATLDEVVDDVLKDQIDDHFVYDDFVVKKENSKAIREIRKKDIDAIEVAINALQEVIGKALEKTKTNVVF